MDQLNELKKRLEVVHDLNAAGMVLNWDQLTYMPPGGVEARARQLSTLGRLAQEWFTSEEVGKLLEDLQPYAESLPYDHKDAALIRVAKRQYEWARRIPPELMARFYQHSATTYQAWVEARAKDNFRLVEPLLEKTLDLSREVASHFPEARHPADPLIEASDFGMTVDLIRPLLAELRKALVPLIEAITSQPPADDSCLKQSFDKEKQIAFGEEVIRHLGFDFQRGRQDQSAHPFTTAFSVHDVRITTRVRENDFSEAFSSTVHEAGHAMYEQGIDPALEGTLLASGTSAGVHESQSRLWENIVGRGEDFWFYFYPRLQNTFPEQLSQVAPDTFLKALNKVQRSLIRTEADEVTYNLHVMIRFELELEMLEGRLRVRHLPEAWNARYQADLKITPSGDHDGCLQDVHWYAGLIGGAFQGYTLGNILSALFYSRALQENPQIPEEMRQGNFSTLRNWLRETIYQHGKIFTTQELVERIGGGGVTVGPYLEYLRRKYSRWYEL